MSAKISYFDARGLCEPLRMIIAVGGEEFEDVRIPMNADPSPANPPQIPPEIKEKCTWGQVPLVEFDGRKLCQSLAQGRYFAKKFKLVGSNDFEAALCDEYVDTSKELLQAWLPAFMENDPVKKEEARKQCMEKVEGRYLKTFSGIIEANGGKYLVGKNLTWADIWLAHVINNVEIVAGAKLGANYPALQQLKDTVFAVPQIKAWVEKRPKSKF